jgi:hypothetical protein
LSPTDVELKTLARVARVTPEHVDRRVVVTWNGRAIWFRRTKAGRRWYVLSREQDNALRRRA